MGEDKHQENGVSTKKPLRENMPDPPKLGDREWSNWYKALVPKTRIGGERRLSVGQNSIMQLPAMPHGLTEGGGMAALTLGSTPPNGSPLDVPTPMVGPGGRRLSATGGRRQSGNLGEINNFLKRENGEHFFYKPVINFLEDQTASVYEFQARGSGPSQVVYCGSTCKERGDKTIRNRIQTYLSNGAHKADAIEDALNRDYEIWIRILPCPGMKMACELENELLRTADYAWNMRDNGGRIRSILKENE